MCLVELIVTKSSRLTLFVVVLQHPLGSVSRRQAGYEDKGRDVGSRSHHSIPFILHLGVDERLGSTRAACLV